MDNDHDSPGGGKITRRRFLLGVGGIGFAVAVAGPFVLRPGKLAAMPDAGGFLVVDLKKCQGCGACMTACSLAHTGTVSMSLARIQIQQDPFATWPDDVFMAPCLQCADAPCVNACPVSANSPDAGHANVRRIDPQRCIGCFQCIDACPYTPKRLQWNHLSRQAQKCDLCSNARYLGEPGGPGGTQACVKVCPVDAISFTETMPDQRSEESYHVNLRGKGWGTLGYTTE